MNLLLSASLCALLASVPGRAQTGGQGDSGQAAGQSSSGEATGQSQAGSATGQSQAGSATGQSSGTQGAAQAGSEQTGSPSGAQAPSQTNGTQTGPETGNAQATAERNAAQAASQNGTTQPAKAAPQPRPNNPEINSAEPRSLPNPNPYGDIPSLKDLYTQVPSAGGTLRRFGSDAFLIGTGNVNELPMDIPVGPDYVLGPGDSLVLNMWGAVSNRLNLTIDRQGEIALPEAGTISITGLTITEAQNAIRKALGSQLQNEQVELSLGRLRAVRIYVVGDVQRPGAYDVSSLSTPLNALYAAGGPTSRGSLRILEQYRGQQLVQRIDLYDFLLRGIRTNVGRLEPGDTILVPPAGPQVTIEGMVHRPAIYELNGEKNLQQVLNLAGGVLITASLKQINVERIVAHERHTMLSLQLTGDQAEVTKELEGFHVQGGDDVIISQILPYNQEAVYLEGHVYRPGKYPYHDGMTINDLLHSYRDVMPEPAVHGEIIRLQAPDFRPEKIGFNLPDVLIGNNPIPLQPFDVVHVYGRYAIDPPTVSIFGQVLHPGAYPMSQGMTAAALVRMAGGFKRSAYRKEADLSSYVVQNGQRVLVKHSVVAIDDAMEGDKHADVLLQPGDVVGIREISGWQDIGSSVTVTGEIKYAGTYGIEEGERLSSVLKRAGGFRADAYPQGAVLERTQVRQMQENNRQEMIQRIESTPPIVALGTGTVQDQQSLLLTIRQQQQEALASLRSHPSTGRLVIQISADISKWENTPADIEMQAGDTLSIPKFPDFVLVNGQVYYPTGLTYRPGKDARWYLAQAGGVTHSGDQKAIFILRANGSVVSKDRSGLFGESVLDVRMNPGDSVVVPEKIIGGSEVWRGIIGTAQIMSAVAITGALAGAW